MFSTGNLYLSSFLLDPQRCLEQKILPPPQTLVLGGASSAWPKQTISREPSDYLVD